MFVNDCNLNRLADRSPLRLPGLQSLDIGNCGFAPSLSSGIIPFFKMLVSQLAATDGRHDGEETVKTTAYCNAGVDGNDHKAVTTEARTGSELDLNGFARCLKTMWLPRQVYMPMRTKLPKFFLMLTSRVMLECGD